MLGKITEIETMGSADGPGVRLVVFLTGCKLRCLYCHNPDSQKADGGREMTADEILKNADGVREFLRNGGITATGGEPLMQLGFLTELFKKAKTKYDFHTCLDTSGATYRAESEYLKKLDTLMLYTDLVMLDIKHIDAEKHKELCLADNKNILAFAKYLEQKEKLTWIRHVVVPDITDKEEDLFKLGEFIGTLGNVKALDVLPYHTMGVSKYKELGIEYPLAGIEALPKEEAVKAKEIILKGIKHR